MAKVLGKDWGLWKTVTTNLQKIKDFLPRLGVLSCVDRIDVDSKIDTLLDAIIKSLNHSNGRYKPKLGKEKSDIEMLRLLIIGHSICLPLSLYPPVRF